MPQYIPLFYTFHFYLFGVLAIAAAITFVTRKSPVAAALWLVVTMFALAAMYILLDAHFIGAIQVLVYAGAIMVVFLFVIMLLNLGHPSELADARGRWGKFAAWGVGLLVLVELWGLTTKAGLPGPMLQLPEGTVPDQVAHAGAVGAIAQPLFSEQLLAFELTSVLLLVAICGAVVLGRRHDGRGRPSAQNPATVDSSTRVATDVAHG